MEFKVSVIVPYYNGSKYIEKTIDSVLKQTLSPIELIIINDGSKEALPQSVQQLQAPFPIRIIEQEQSGQSHARNVGVSHAVGDYVAFLDQDDLWYEEFLESVCQPFLSYRRLGWVYSNLDEIDGQGRVFDKNILDKQKFNHPKKSIAQMLSHLNLIFPSSALILKKAFQEVGGFDPELCGYEDDDLFVRLFTHGWEHQFINTALLQWRNHAHNTSRSPAMDRSRLIYFRKQKERWPDHSFSRKLWSSDCLFPYFFNNTLNEYFSCCLKEKNFCRAALLMDQCVEFLQLLPRHTRIRYRLFCFFLQQPRCIYCLYLVVATFIPLKWLRKSFSSVF